MWDGCDEIVKGERSAVCCEMEGNRVGGARKGVALKDKGVDTGNVDQYN